MHGDSQATGHGDHNDFPISQRTNRTHGPQLEAVGPHSQDAEALLADLVESIEDAVISLSTDGTIVQWNPSAQRLFGHTTAQKVDCSVMQIHLASLWSAEWAFTLHTPQRERLATCEALLAHGNGSGRLVLCHLRTMFCAAGNAVGSTLVARDVSERRCAKAQLRHLSRAYPLAALARRQACGERLTDLMQHTVKSSRSTDDRDAELERLRLLNDALGLAACADLFRSLHPGTPGWKQRNS